MKVSGGKNEQRPLMKVLMIPYRPSRKMYNIHVHTYIHTYIHIYIYTYIYIYIYMYMYMCMYI